MLLARRSACRTPSSGGSNEDPIATSPSIRSPGRVSPWGFVLERGCIRTGIRVRDRAQLALLERFRARLPPTAIWSTEVPLPIPGDRRAWDACIAVGGRRAGCEAETRLTDVQALERRLALKVRDGEVDLLLLIVSDTAANRQMLALHRGALRTLLPLDGRDVLQSLGSGRLPEASGLLVI